MLVRDCEFGKKGSVIENSSPLPSISQSASDLTVRGFFIYINQRSTMSIKPIKLKAEHIPGQGWVVKALVPKPFCCVEFTLKAGEQPILNGRDGNSIVRAIADDVYIQFKPQEWDEMIGKVFTEMVALWNKKHGYKEDVKNFDYSPYLCRAWKKGAVCAYFEDHTCPARSCFNQRAT